MTVLASAHQVLFLCSVSYLRCVEISNLKRGLIIGYFVRLKVSKALIFGMYKIEYRKIAI